MLHKSAIIRIIAILLMTAALAACNTGRTKVSTGYYNIKGTTAKQLDRQIKLKGPKVSKQHAVAVTQISLIPDITVKGNKSSCRIYKAFMNVDAKIKLPKWENKTQGSKKLRNYWGSYAGYAKEHEETHVKIAKAFAKKTAKVLRKMPTYPGCKALTKAIKRVLKKMSQAHNKAQLQFDADEKKRFRRLIANSKRKAKRKKS